MSLSDTGHRQGAAPLRRKTGHPAAPDAPAAHRRRRLEPLLFVAALVAQLIPILLLRHLGTQDGPSHLATARVLLDHGDAAHPIYAHYYWLDAFPSPNLATEGLLTVLTAILSPEVAEKVLAAGYLVALPLAVRHVVGRIDRGAVWLSYAAIPLGNGFLFASGFFNYCYGVVVFVLGAGWVFTSRRRSGRRYVLVLAGWLLLAYLTHYIPAALLALVAVVPPLASARGRGLGWVRDGLRRLGPTLLAMVPLAVLSVFFLLRPAPGESRRDNPLALLVQLPVLVKPVVAMSYAEYPVAIALGVVLVALVVFVAVSVRRGSVSGRAGQIAAAAAACYVLYLAAPEGTAQGGAINARLALFPPLLALLWLASLARPAGLAGSAAPARLVRGTAITAFLLAAAALAVLRWPVELRHSRQVDAYVDAAAQVRPGSTILGLQYESANIPKVRGFSDPTLHGASLVAVLTDGVDVGHYEAELSYFPTRFRRETDLRRQVDPTLRGMDFTPSRIATLTDESGRGLVDYVLVRGDADRVPAAKQAQAQRITDGLRAYRLVGTFGDRTGPGTAPLRLYQRR